MKRAFCSGFKLALALLGFATIGLPSAFSADYLPGRYLNVHSAGTLALSCDNGRIYPLRVRAVSDAGEIVTGYLVLGYGQVHVRLIPMGNGYRYAGRGVWFDGKHEVAVLYFGLHNAVGCTVVRDGVDGVVISAKG